MLAGATWRLSPDGGAPEPALVDGPWRVGVAVGLPFLAAAGYVLALRAPAAGGWVALLPALALAALGPFELRPALAAALGAALTVPALLLAVGGIRRPAGRIAAGAGAVLLCAGAAVASAWGHEFMYGATHPESTVAPPPAGAVRWVWAGGVGSTSATVVAAVRPDTGPVALDVKPRARVRAERIGDVVRFTLTGLRPDRRHRYAVRVGGRDDGSGGGAFRTTPVGPVSFTVAVASCARTGSNGAVFDAIRAEEPLLYVNTGDIFYADIDEDAPGRFRRAWDRTLTRPAQAALYRATATAYVWDDHDFGDNDSDGASPSRPAAHRVYREYVPHHPFALPGADAPVAQAFTIGRVRFLLTDTRSDRISGGPRRTMLGDTQRDWLLRELGAANGRYPVIVWINPDPWIGPAREGSDSWNGFAEERREIAEFVASRRIRGLVMLSGDNHAVAIDDGTNTGYADGGAGGFPLLHAGALDRHPHRVTGPFSHGAFPGGGRYGLLEVRDDGGEEVVVTLRGRDWRRRDLTSLELRFAAPVSGG